MSIEALSAPAVPDFPPPPTPFAAPNTISLGPGTVLHRIWHRDYSGDAFNPGKGKPTRFAPIYAQSGTVIPTLYASSSCECAFHERIFHDVPLEADFRSLHIRSVEALLYGTLRVERSLQVATLFRPDLARWHIERHQLVHTEAIAYRHTARWAEAIHTQDEALHGMVWTSHRCDPYRAYVFFGDRVLAGSLVPQGDAREIMEDPALLEELLAYAERASIRLLTS